MTWKMLDLFSGIGGFSLAAQWCWGDELEIVSFVEIDPFCQKVLKKHWPNVPIVGDVRDVKVVADSEGEQVVPTKSGRFHPKFNLQGVGGRIDLLTGGFPCQPFSCAGKRKGREDDRFLWPEMLRVVQEFRPRWIVAENVAGIVRMALDDCLSDLEGEGYTTGTQIIPACAVNAPHRRDRVWIVAHHGTVKYKGSLQTSPREGGWRTTESCSSGQDVSDPNDTGWGEQRRTKPIQSGNNPIECSDWWLTEPSVGRVAHGVPSRVDRLKSLGNAIVPQVAYQIMKAIKEAQT